MILLLFSNRLRLLNFLFHAPFFLFFYYKSWLLLWNHSVLGLKSIVVTYNRDDGIIFLVFQINLYYSLWVFYLILYPQLLLLKLRSMWRISAACNWILEKRIWFNFSDLACSNYLNFMLIPISSFRGKRKLSVLPISNTHNKAIIEMLAFPHGARRILKLYYRICSTYYKLDIFKPQSIGLTQC